MDASATLALTLALPFAGAYVLNLIRLVVIPRMRQPIFIIGTGDPNRITLFLPGGTAYPRVTIRQARRIARRNMRRMITR